MLPKTEILKIKFNTSSSREILEYVTSKLHEDSEKIFIVTPNPELVVLASASPSYRMILNSAQFSLPDGVGIVWASRVLEKPLRSRISGVDFMKSLCENVSNQPVMIGLFGAQQGVAEEAAECLRKLYPNLQISYASHEWDEDKIRDTKVDILFVALGSPKQEKWIYENLEKLPVKVVMGVGGSFDMISGKVRRAPSFMRTLGLEWLWRLIQQPWRWRRQSKLLKFVYLVLREKLSV